MADNIKFQHNYSNSGLDLLRKNNKTYYILIYDPVQHGLIMYKNTCYISVPLSAKETAISTISNALNAIYPQFQIIPDKSRYRHNNIYYADNMDLYSVILTPITSIGDDILLTIIDYNPNFPIYRLNMQYISIDKNIADYSQLQNKITNHVNGNNVIADRIHKFLTML